jgi:hypothetical protein
MSLSQWKWIISYLTARENNQVLRFSTEMSSLTGLAQFASEWVAQFTLEWVGQFTPECSLDIGFDLFRKEQ